ncbi:hypothetical protein [Solibacillus sp.]|uniref:hypothetical protein n=1 Tax=Solibacillus sp. TaxID=1909654 RepID=UPI003315117D
MKVLFTSDLDRTLIFSTRTKLQDVAYEGIEKLSGRTISYMSKVTYTQLSELHNMLDFVPVTTRSLKQYKRLTLFQGALQPKLAIVANGGIILREGIVDEVWQERMMRQMAALPLLYEQLPEQFKGDFTAPVVLEVLEMDNLFYVLKVDGEKLEHQELTRFQSQLQRYGWTCNLQGKKLYVLPQFLTKGLAVDYIKQQSMYNWHVAAGDAALDLPMLALADTRFIPQHGELAKDSLLHGFPITPKESSNFSEYILRKIITTIKNKNEKGEDHDKSII